MPKYKITAQEIKSNGDLGKKQEKILYECDGCDKLIFKACRTGKEVLCHECFYKKYNKEIEYAANQKTQET